MASYKNMFGLWTNDSKLDEKLGLTEGQKKLVQNTWAIVKKDQVASGVAVMLAYFTKHPEYQQSFKPFKDMPIDQLPGNKRFQAHCAGIIATISTVIDSLQDFDLLVANIEIFTERHRKRGQKQKEFEDLKPVMAEVLREAIGTEYTPEVEEAWAKTLDVFFATICANLG
ncbi:globin CTT-E/E' [Polistes fuscatus]|uniref:globin CTT-E/E' n=1 Tax=Polistes fuscatus TaxID=30207 RepID=UPI001CA89F4B|nr:globin CTT-E/E' [Polistes fuscatus]